MPCRCDRNIKVSIKCPGPTTNKVPVQKPNYKESLEQSLLDLEEGNFLVL